MAELNDDLEALDEEVEAYLIHDEEEVARKTQVWERMNADYLEAQAEKEAARAEAERLALEGGEQPSGAPTALSMTHVPVHVHEPMSVTHVRDHVHAHVHVRDPCTYAWHDGVHAH